MRLLRELLGNLAELIALAEAKLTGSTSRIDSATKALYAKVGADAMPAMEADAQAAAELVREDEAKRFVWKAADLVEEGTDRYCW